MKRISVTALILLSLFIRCEKDDSENNSTTTSTTSATSNSSTTSNTNTTSQFNTSTYSNAEIDSIVKKLAGDGCTITNIKSNIFGKTNYLAFFNYTSDILEIESGIVLSTGAANKIFAPNDNHMMSHNFNVYANGPIVSQIRNELSNNLATIYDPAIIEFDLKINSDSLGFNYVFGSEEYPEYVGVNFSDVFCFFISGPGINDTLNLAKIDDKPISINTLNSSVNSAYYISNGNGLTPLVNSYLQFDGLSKKLKANIAITPNETYHLKIVIADVGDQLLDSGVFLEFSSFKGN